ncbi:fungal-specific transcription factor domain-domain-containing protein [Microdochium bolleyi]|uniref:Fungal-specific transcription factor domain-domain-containing protein n=1 Tax=Microdochium bolleyi TaxID=196109 RepID=A0A136IVQ3_9PEZI|nr:fungal-specific transcription factor domain-domain-containing protein [Microdochium bolleyi]
MPPALGARRVIACQQCHHRKVRCDAARPRCANCARAGVSSCVYPPDPRQHRQHVQARLEERIRRLEAENSSLAGQVQESQSRRASDYSDHGRQQQPSGGLAQYQPQQSDVANQVIHLSLSAGGGRTYVGSTSGLFLANLLQPHTQQASAQQHQHGNGISAFPMAGGSLPLASGPHHANATSSPPILLNTLPAESLAREIKDAYAAHDHLIYPIVTLPALERAFDSVYTRSHDRYPNSDLLFDEFVVDMVLAIGTAQLSKLHWAGVSDAEVHYSRAMLKANAVLGTGGIASLQAILLICQYRMGTSSHDTTNSVWHLVGVAARTCYELGLHKSATYQQFRGDSDNSVSADESHSGCRERAEQLEARFNCFWSTVALDRVASLTLGRPLAMQLEDIDVDLMALQREDPFPETPAPANSVQSPIETRTLPLSTTERRTRGAIFTHIVKYRVICGKVLNALHRTTSDEHRAQTSHVDYIHIRDQLAQELQNWHAETRSSVLVSPSGRDHHTTAATPATPATPATTTSTSSRTESLSSFRSPEWFDLLFHNGNLMLFRPSPSIPSLSSSDTTTTTTARNNSIALQRTFDSSRAAIGLYASLHQTRKINYSWATLHSVFMAGLSYIYALRTHFQHARLQSSSSSSSSRSQQPQQQRGQKSMLEAAPSIIQVVNDTRACSKVLVAVSERWGPSTTRNCSEVFDKLSDAVVADVVEAQTQGGHGRGGRRHDTSAPGHDPRTESTSDSSAASSMFNMTVDNTLRDCYTDIQNLFYDTSQNEAIARLSQDWLFGIEEGAAATATAAAVAGHHRP